MVLAQYHSYMCAAIRVLVVWSMSNCVPVVTDIHHKLTGPFDHH